MSEWQLSHNPCDHSIMFKCDSAVLLCYCYSLFVFATVFAFVVCNCISISITRTAITMSHDHSIMFRCDSAVLLCYCCQEFKNACMWSCFSFYKYNFFGLSGTFLQWNKWKLSLKILEEKILCFSDLRLPSPWIEGLANLAGGALLTILLANSLHLNS